VQFPVTIELRRSRLLSLLLVFFHTSAAACVIALPWPWFLRAALLGLVALSLFYASRPSQIVGLHLSGGRNDPDCLLADGNRAKATVLPDSTVFIRLIVLRLQLGEEKRASSITLLPDQMSVEQFRVLRLWLRWRTESKERFRSVS
jgi:hypothetical protein